MSLFLKILITQNLKLKSQNKTIGHDLHHFIYVLHKIMTFPTLF